jgi:hypothetical protein
MTLISLAFLLAAAMIWRASSKLMPSVFPIDISSLERDCRR